MKKLNIKPYFLIVIIALHSACDNSESNEDPYAHWGNYVGTYTANVKLPGFAGVTMPPVEDSGTLNLSIFREARGTASSNVYDDYKIEGGEIGDNKFRCDFVGKQNGYPSYLGHFIGTIFPETEEANGNIINNEDEIIGTWSAKKE